MTSYQTAVISDIRREQAARLAAYKKQYGSRFLDVICVSTDGHAPGHDSFSLSFGSKEIYGNRSHARGFTLASFAKKAFPAGGSLRLIERKEGFASLVAVFSFLGLTAGQRGQRFL